ncbi:MAG: hypothetical protein GX605_09630 [Chloroflexi bacterium]|nr:hypothetical protein [Chloroflexota bacterium]
MAMAKPKWLVEVTQSIWRRFPEMKAVQPTYSARLLAPKQAGPTGKTGVGGAKKLHTLTFRKTFALDEGGKTTRIVRVVADDEGKILKVVCSR